MVSPPRMFVNVTFLSSTTPASPCLSSKTPSARVSSPRASSPRAASSRVSSLRVSSPRAISPKASSPKVFSPRVSSPRVSSPGASSPRAFSPKVISPRVSCSPRHAPSRTPSLLFIEPGRSSPDSHRSIKNRSLRQRHILWWIYIVLGGCQVIGSILCMVIGMLAVMNMGTAVNCVSDDPAPCTTGGAFAYPTFFSEVREARVQYWSLAVEFFVFSALICIVAMISGVVCVYIALRGFKYRVLKGLLVTRICGIVVVSLFIGLGLCVFRLLSYFCAIRMKLWKDDHNPSVLLGSDQICSKASVLSAILPLMVVTFLTCLAILSLFFQRLDRYFQLYALWNLLLFTDGVVCLVIAINTSIYESQLTQHIRTHEAIIGHAVLTADIASQLPLLFGSMQGILYPAGLFTIGCGIFGLWVSWWRSLVHHVFNILITFVCAVVLLSVTISTLLPSAITSFLCNYEEYPVVPTEEAKHVMDHICTFRVNLRISQVFLLLCFVLYLVVFFFYICGLFCWKPNDWKPKERLVNKQSTGVNLSTKQNNLTFPATRKRRATIQQ